LQVLKLGKKHKLIELPNMLLSQELVEEFFIRTIFRETVWEIFFKLSYFVSKGDLHSLQVIRMLATLG